MFTRDMVNSTRSEHYQYDPLNRLTQMTRGTLAQDGSQIETLLNHPVLDKTQQWPAPASRGLDERGNWQTWVRSKGSDPSQTERRTFNGANEYETSDPDGDNGPLDPVALAYDAVGRLITDPTASNVGDVSTNGQRYVYSPAGRMLAAWRTNGTVIGRLITGQGWALQNRPVVVDFLYLILPCSCKPDVSAE